MGLNPTSLFTNFNLLYLEYIRLEPVDDATQEGADEEGARLGRRDGLRQREHERQVTVNALVLLQHLGRLDALPRRRDLDQDALLANAGLLVELQESIVSDMSCPVSCSHPPAWCG